MALTANDLAFRGWQRQVAAGNDVSGTATWRIMGMTLTAGVDAATMKVYNAATATGTDLIQVNAAIATTETIMFGPNGTSFDNVSIALTGTAPFPVVFYVVE